MFKKDERWLWVAWCVAGAVGCAAVTWSWQIKDDKDIFDAISAIGALASAAIALVAWRVAHNTHARTVEADETRAKLIGQKWVAVLRNAQPVLDAIASWAESHLRDFTYSAEQANAKLIELQDVRAMLKVPLEELLLLAYLPDNCANRFVQIESSLQFQVGKVRQFLDDEARRPPEMMPGRRVLIAFGDADGDHADIVLLLRDIEAAIHGFPKGPIIHRIRRHPRIPAAH